MCRSANACQNCGSAMRGAIRSLYFLEILPTDGSEQQSCELAEDSQRIGEESLRHSPEQNKKYK